MISLVHSNEQRSNEQRYLSLSLTSYLHRLADENVYESKFYEVIPCILLTILLFFTEKFTDSVPLIITRICTVE